MILLLIFTVEFWVQVENTDSAKVYLHCLSSHSQLPNIEWRWYYVSREERDWWRKNSSGSYFQLYPYICMEWLRTLLENLQINSGSCVGVLVIEWLALIVSAVADIAYCHNPNSPSPLWIPFSFDSSISSLFNAFNERFKVCSMVTTLSLVYDLQLEEDKSCGTQSIWFMWFVGWMQNFLSIHLLWPGGLCTWWWTQHENFHMNWTKKVSTSLYHSTVCCQQSWWWVAN